MEPSKSKMPQSKSQIKCGYCDVSMRRDRLKEHTTNKHPGLSAKEASTRSKDIKHMFFDMTKAKKRPLDISEQECSEVEDTTKKKKVEDRTAQQDMNILDTGVAGTSKQEPGVHEKLDTIIDKLSQLSVSVGKTNRTELQDEYRGKQETQSKPKDTVDENMAMKILIQQSKSVERLCAISKLNADFDNNVLVCEICDSDDHGGDSRHGKFAYDFLLGVHFTDNNQPRAFINLKKSVARHIVDTAHQQNMNKLGQENEQNQRFQKGQKAIGLIVGTQAYKLLKQCRPYSDFETDMMLLANARVNVGNINHSRKFPSALRPTFAEVMDIRLKNYLSTPLAATSTEPPIGIVADKLTTRRRTGQMFAGIIFSPGMPSLLTPVSLGVEVVSKHDGDSIAQDTRDMCFKYSLKPDQIAGFGFDGQYFNLNVDEKLREKMPLNESICFVWDPAHKLQLADKDMRVKHSEMSWIEDMCTVISSINSKFSYGKHYEHALDFADEHGLDLKAPKWFSDTRFAAYAYRVFYHFLENYGILRGVLETTAAGDDKKTSDEAENLLRQIRTLDFLVKTMLLCNHYQELGIVSQILQQVNIPFWKRANAIEKYMTKLQTMKAGNLPVLQKPGLTEKTRASAPTMSMNDLKNSEFGGFPLFAQDIGLITPLRQTRGMSTCEKDSTETVCGAIEHIIQTKGKNMFRNMDIEMNIRFPEKYFKQMKSKEVAVSLLPILNAAKTAANQDSFLQAEEVRAFKSKHSTQQEGATNLCKNIFQYKCELSNYETDIEIYHCVFTQPKLYIGAAHCLATIANIFCSEPPESIVESMGSIIEKIKDVRGGSKSSTNKKDVIDISDELKIHWNGPPLNKADSVVRQALNIHFQGRPWHFTATDVRSKMYKVSAVVDRINHDKPSLSFMAE